MNLLNFTQANCKNCYKCLRACHVKAVKIKNDQAGIVEDRCIGCGQCFLVCPQDARSIKSNLSEVKSAIKEGRKVIASIAPSYIGAYEQKLYGQFNTALQRLGFSHVEETAVGAEAVSFFYDKLIEASDYENIITTCCPSANYLIEKYYPELTKYLIPCVSPMLAHGKLLKHEYGMDSYIVFIGPCVAKKIEAISFQHKGLIDAVLTFDELKNWIDEESIDISTLNISEFSNPSFQRGSAYPLLGGVLKSFGSGDKGKEFEKLRVDGFDDCVAVLESLNNGNLSKVCIEFNICRGGCINGPGMPKGEGDLYIKQKRVKDYVQTLQKISDTRKNKYSNIDFGKVFIARPVTKINVSENELGNVLISMGKFDSSDELNCGGCGYNTCRDKAFAVLEGMAEMNMCMPYMRNKAESLANVIFENSPNIIMVIDKDLLIKELNPSGEKAFRVRASEIKNKPLSYILEDKAFYEMLEYKKPMVSQKTVCKEYNIVLYQNILYLEKQNAILAIMTDITEQEKQKEDLKHMKANALAAAQKVIEKQMRVAQEIASLLGETTAETKITLTKLKEIALQETGDIK